MKFKVAILQVDDQLLENEQYNFETEMGWIETSGIHSTETFSIPEYANDNPIDYVWLQKQVRDSLDGMKELGSIDDYSSDLEEKLIQDIFENHESIDQDIDFRVCDFLSLDS